MKPNHIHVTVYADGGIAVGPTDQPITPWTQRHSKSGAPCNVAESVMRDVGATIAELREDGLEFLARKDKALWELIVGTVETWETWEIRRLAELLVGYADLRDDGLVPKREL